MLGDEAYLYKRSCGKRWNVLKAVEIQMTTYMTVHNGDSRAHGLYHHHGKLVQALTQKIGARIRHLDETELNSGYLDEK